MKTRRTVPVAVLALASAALVTATATPAEAATIGVKPARVVPVGTSIGSATIASNGTIYATSGGASSIDVWSPTSDGEPVVTKTFTGVNVGGFPSLSASLGLAWVDSSGAGSVVVINPGQAGGAAVPTRTITGPATQIGDPLAVAWTPSGALWVVDGDIGGSSGVELLRFAPGATGDTAPVRVISGAKTRLRSSFNQLSIAGLPGDGVAVSPAGVAPQFSVFTAGQSGNVAPARRVVVPTSSPHWITQGLASDPQGRVYIGSGNVEGDEFGRLDVYGPTANGTVNPLVTLGGTKQRFQVPVAPSVAANGTVAVVDATLVLTGGSSLTSAEVQVFRPLFTKAGKVSGLAVRKSSSTATATWSAPSNPSGTPLTYKVVVKKGTKVLLSKTTSSRSLAIKRSTLPTGTLTVSVSAVNLGGTGSAASRTFTR